MDTDTSHWLDALAGSHDGLAARVGELDAEQLRRRSYCTDWTVAQVLAHLGSGAEIFSAFLEAVVDGVPPPTREGFPAIWDRWNAMTPEQQAEGFVTHDGQLVESLEGLGDRLDSLEFTMFGGMRIDAVGFLAMRLSEHAVHAWDVAVTYDPDARVDGEAVGLLVDRLGFTGERIGRAEGAGDDRPFAVGVRTTDPERRFVISVDDRVRIAEGAGEAPDLVLPAEALLRLVYGRLDPQHAPDIPSTALPVLDRLRRVFPGM